MNKVDIKNICMNYHTITSETIVLKNISFSVKEEEFLTIVGPSGCGKSTLLNIIAGLLTPSKGKIYIHENKIRTLEKNIGYMFQKDQLFEWISVWENVILGLKIQKIFTEKNKDYVISLLRHYGLWNFRNHYPKQLSGGMRQRVALIRTLATNPDVLLLDEPFSALDYQTRLKISNEVFKIIRDEKKTVIMVTHDIPEAISMSDRIIILSNRPAEIRKTEIVNFSKEYSSPLKRREAPNFRLYFNSIWKELDSNVK